MTKHVVYDREQACIEWAARTIGMGGFGRDAHAIGQLDGEEIVAAIVYDDFTPWNCTMHVASDCRRRWLNRDLLFRAFAFPFLQLRLRRVTGIVRADNERALRFDRKLGFKDECVASHLFGDHDGIVLRMLREDCRWIGA